MGKMISVVVPVYNNEPTLEETCRQIIEVHAAHFSDLSLQMIFVNDGSKDGSWKELLRLRKVYSDKITLVDLSRNFGQLGALFAGFHQAEGDAVICVSADLQDPISLMSRMVTYWKNDTEIVICHREKRDDGFFTRVFSSLAYSIARLSYAELPKGGFDYWLMSRRVCKLLCSFKGRHNFLQGYLLSVGYSKAFIPYTRLQRKAGTSGYSFWKKIKIIVDFFVDSSYLPIRFMSGLGTCLAISGLIYSLAIVYGWMRHKTPFPGWAPIMIMVMIVGGMIMIMLGVIGEYIWRIYDNCKDFPLFIVNEKPSENETK
jgi:polyisoprenyl-phosphate glycosyltransferase